MTTLFTIGYQGHTVDTLIDTLRAHGVAHLLDVRKLPISRKRGFAKKALAAHLAEAGIGYTHIAALGTPKDLRDEVRRTHDYPAFFAAMEAVIAGQPAALDEALAIARAQPSALLCFEANHAECHRDTVANALVRRDQALVIEHV